MATESKHAIDLETRWNFGESRSTLSLDEFLDQKEADGAEFFAGKEPWLKGVDKLNWQTFSGSALTPSFCSAVRSGLLQFLRMSSSDPKLPQKKKGVLGWQFALIAVCGIAFGLYSLGQHIFFPDPEFTQGYLIFSVVLDLIIIVACGVTITLFVIQRTASENSDPGKR